MVIDKLERTVHFTMKMNDNNEINEISNYLLKKLVDNKICI